MSDRDLLRGVAWRELFPWLLIFRTFRLSINGGILLFAALGAVLTPVGWRVCAQVCNVDNAEYAQLQAWPWQATWMPAVADGESGAVVINLGSRLFQQPACLLVPLAKVVSRQTPWQDLIYCGLAGVWTLLVWAFCGGVITRIAVVGLGRGERVGISESVRHVLQRLSAYFGAPLFPLLSLIPAIMTGWVVGGLLRLDVGVLLMAMLWPIMLVGGLLLAIMLVGLFLGWPFMWVTASAEEVGDVFESVQRGYSYAWERPLHYLFYAVLAILYGLLGLAFVTFFAYLVIEMSWWMASYGAGNERVDKLLYDELVGAANGGMALIRFWQYTLTTLAAAFAYSYFWVAMSAIYLLLRRDVDEAMPFDEVYLPEESEHYTLPLDMSEQAASEAEGKPDE